MIHLGTRRSLVALIALVATGCGTTSSGLLGQSGAGSLGAPAGGMTSAQLYETLDSPDLSESRRVKLWATHYSVHTAVERSGNRGCALLDVKGRSLGVRLNRKDWCRAAMQGTVSVQRHDGSFDRFQFVRPATEEQVDCRDIFPKHPSIGRSRFKRVRTPRLAGAHGARLIPYRSIAVDKRTFRNGTLLYVPSAKGTVIHLQDGREWTHDGYFFVADRGGGLEGAHIDIFLGQARKNPFTFAKSSDRHRFDAYVVTDPELVQRMAALHEMTVVSPPIAHRQGQRRTRTRSLQHRRNHRPRHEAVLTFEPEPHKQRRRQPDNNQDENG